MIRAVWDQGFKRSYKKRVRNNSRLKKSQETNTPNSGIVATPHPLRANKDTIGVKIGHRGAKAQRHKGRNLCIQNSTFKIQHCFSLFLI